MIVIFKPHTERRVNKTIVNVAIMSSILQDGNKLLDDYDYEQLLFFDSVYLNRRPRKMVTRSLAERIAKELDHVIDGASSRVPEWTVELTTNLPFSSNKDWITENLSNHKIERIVSDKIDNSDRIAWHRRRNKMFNRSNIAEMIKSLGGRLL